MLPGFSSTYRSPFQIPLCPDLTFVPSARRRSPLWATGLDSLHRTALYTENGLFAASLRTWVDPLSEIPHSRKRL